MHLILITMKNKIYLSLSIAVLFTTFFAIATGDGAVGVLDHTLSIQWIVLLIFCLVLPLVNTAEIIINNRSRNVLYWIGLLLNVITIFFVMRYFEIELL
jgi:uncharacterized membrane protein